MNTKRVLNAEDAKYFFNTSINTMNDAIGEVTFDVKNQLVSFNFNAALLFRFPGLYADTNYHVYDSVILPDFKGILKSIKLDTLTMKSEFDYKRTLDDKVYHFTIKVDKVKGHVITLFCLCFEKLLETEEQIGLYSDVIGSGLSLFTGCTWWIDYDRYHDQFYQSDSGPQILGIDVAKDKKYSTAEFQKVRQKAREVSELYDESITFEVEAYEKVRSNKTDYFAGRTPAVTKEDMVVWVESYGKCFLRYPDGTPRLFIAIDIYMTDIYEEKTQLDLINNLFDTGLVNSDVGVWYYQKQFLEGKYYFTKSFQELMTDTEVYTNQNLTEKVDQQIKFMEEDGNGHEVLLHEFRKTHNRVFYNKIDKYDIVIPNFKNKDTLQWIEIRGTVIDRDEEGNITLFVGVNVDVTESYNRNRELERLRVQNERLQLAEKLATKARDLLVWYYEKTEEKENYIFGNKLIESKLGIPRGKEGRFLINDILSTMELDPEYKEDFYRVKEFYSELNKGEFLAFNPAISKHKNKVTSEVLYIEHSAEVSTIEISQSGILIGGLMLDVTETVKAQSKIRFLADYDTLTGVNNRNYFENFIKFRLPSNYSIFIFDVDGLKLINDAFGHLEGDQIIKQLANFLKDIYPDAYFIARIGGDEFAVLSKMTDPDEITKKANLLEKVIEDFNAISNIEMIVSKGGKIVVNNDIEFEKAFVQAENLMYRRKLNNRKSRKSKVLESILETLNAKTEETKDHSERLSLLAVKTMEGLNRYRSSEIEDIKLLALVHDIGKITVDDKILKKESRLDPNEFELVKKHSEAGYKIIRNITDSDDVCNGVLFHHERWDGNGYPQGLSGKDIPLFARVISVVDSYDAMTNDRIYRKAISHEEAVEEIIRCSGSQFDPAVVKAFLKSCFGIEQ